RQNRARQKRQIQKPAKFSPVLLFLGVRRPGLPDYRVERLRRAEKIQSWSRCGSASNAARASARRPGRLPSEAGKFEPQAMRSAPNSLTTREKKLSGVALP